MNKFAELDAAIIEAIRDKKSPIYDRRVTLKADPIAAEKRCESYRVIDRRLQAMRKAGRIAFERPADFENKQWIVKDAA